MLEYLTAANEGAQKGLDFFNLSNYLTINMAGKKWFCCINFCRLKLFLSFFCYDQVNFNPRPI